MPTRLAECDAVGAFGIKTYIPEPESQWQRVRGWEAVVRRRMTGEMPAK